MEKELGSESSCVYVSYYLSPPAYSVFKPFNLPGFYFPQTWQWWSNDHGDPKL